MHQATMDSSTPVPAGDRESRCAELPIHFFTIVLNGGVTDDEQIAAHLQHVDGVMLGREAYHHPWLMTGWDARFWGGAPNPRTRAEVEAAMVAYMQREAVEDGTPWSAIARHMLGLHHGERGARLWRQIWSDHRRKSLPATEVAAQAAAVLADARADALASV